MICPQYRPLIGGYERAAERLSKALVVDGHQVTVLAERRDCRWPKIEVSDGVSVKRFWCHYRPSFHMLTAIASMSFYLLRHGLRFDVWHVHQYGLHCAVAVFLGRLMRRPVVLKLTSSGPQSISRVSSSSFFGRCVANLMRQVNAVVALTRETFQEAVDFGVSSDRITQIGNGIDVEKFRPVSPEVKRILRNKLSLPEQGVTVAAVGRLVNLKNYVGLLEAWAQFVVAHENQRQYLIIVGDGPDRSVLEEKIRNSHLTGRVFLVGNQENVDEWLNASDMFVLSSNFEGLSNTLLEAMSCGLPVVATAVSGTKELVADTHSGIVVDVGDIDGLSNGIAMLANSVELRDLMGAVGRNVVLSQYSTRSVAQAHAALYEDLILKK
jgi:glycosyltransferase involved in cell wall biosynthesis